MINYILLFISVSLETGKNAAFESFSKRESSGVVDLGLFNTITYISAVPVLLLFFIFGKNHSCSLFTLVTAVGFALVNMLAQFCYIKAISYGSMTCTTLISCCGFLISTVFSVICYSEKVRVMQIILLPILVLALALTMDLRRGGVNFRWMIFAFGSMLFTGLIGVMQKVHQESGHGGEMSLFLLISFILMALISGMTLPRGKKPRADRAEAKLSCSPALPLAIFSGAALGMIHSLNLYLSGVLPSIVFFPVVNGGLILMTAMVSVVVFHERLKVKQIAGLILGVIIISVM